MQVALSEPMQAPEQASQMHSLLGPNAANVEQLSLEVIKVSSKRLYAALPAHHLCSHAVLTHLAVCHNQVPTSRE
jgi:hypothetical protein